MDIGPRVESRVLIRYKNRCESLVDRSVDTTRTCRDQLVDDELPDRLRGQDVGEEGNGDPDREHLLIDSQHGHHTSSALLLPPWQPGVGRAGGPRRGGGVSWSDMAR